MSEFQIIGLVAVNVFALMGLGYQTQVMWSKVIDMQIKQIDYDIQQQKMFAERFGFPSHLPEEI